MLELKILFNQAHTQSFSEMKLSPCLHIICCERAGGLTLIDGTSGDFGLLISGFVPSQCFWLLISLFYFEKIAVIKLRHFYRSCVNQKMHIYEFVIYVFCYQNLHVSVARVTPSSECLQYKYQEYDGNHTKCVTGFSKILPILKVV